jgi:hypothetical protein
MRKSSRLGASGPPAPQAVFSTLRRPGTGQRKLNSEMIKCSCACAPCVGSAAHLAVHEVYFRYAVITHGNMGPL